MPETRPKHEHKISEIILASSQRHYLNQFMCCKRSTLLKKGETILHPNFSGPEMENIKFKHLKIVSSPRTIYLSIYNILSRFSFFEGWHRPRHTDIQSPHFTQPHTLAFPHSLSRAAYLTSARSFARSLFPFPQQEIQPITAATQNVRFPLSHSNPAARGRK